MYNKKYSAVGQVLTGSGIKEGEREKVNRKEKKETITQHNGKQDKHEKQTKSAVDIDGDFLTKTNRSFPELWGITFI